MNNTPSNPNLNPFNNVQANPQNQSGQLPNLFNSQVNHEMIVVQTIDSNGNTITMSSSDNRHPDDVMQNLTGQIFNNLTNFVPRNRNNANTNVNVNANANVQNNTRIPKFDVEKVIV